MKEYKYRIVEVQYKRIKVSKRKYIQRIERIYWLNSCDDFEYAMNYMNYYNIKPYKDGNEFYLVDMQGNFYEIPGC
jgi:hypothetical protein